MSFPKSPNPQHPYVDQHQLVSWSPCGLELRMASVDDASFGILYKVEDVFNLGTHRHGLLDF